jgi:squalene-hopene/tetraprenyl-beta-curcumene cyclase
MSTETKSKFSFEGLKERVGATIRRSQDYFLRVQYPEGYWWAELESNPTMEAEHLLLAYFLGYVDEERSRKISQDIRNRQREDGSWGMYYGAPGDLSTSVECYFALKLAGVGTDDPAMDRAKEFILSKGGVPNVRVFTKIWLALFGQWDWAGTPAMPPEIMLLPSWAPFSIYRFSSWARATIVPMLILLTDHPVCPIPAEAAIDDLYPMPRERVKYSLPRRGGLLSLEAAFLVADKAIQLYNRIPLNPLKELARHRAERWIVEHQEADGSWGGIQPPWVYALLALKHRGYDLEHPVMKLGLEGFKDKWSLEYQDGAAMRVQACLSPVWDTCLALVAMLDSDMPPDHPSVQEACRYLLKEEIRVPGDWAKKVKGVEPSGWAFEFENDLYPDVDDTAIILIGLDQCRLPEQEEEQRRLAVRRGVGWTLAMQSSNGGWAAFDKDNNTTLLARIPFADFGEVLDPPSSDVTAHVLEALGRLGYTKEHPAVRRGLKFMMEHQEPDGSWFGRWGVNCVYGCGAVLPALEALGEDMSQPAVQRAVDWLIGHQNVDGGWGESCASYADPSLRGVGESTASQTAWALMGLLAADLSEHEATIRGLAFLTDSQQEDGTWEEPHFTGCGFPGYGIGDQPDRLPQEGDSNFQGQELSAGFMINYHMYRNYFPLMALGRYRRATESKGN